MRFAGGILMVVIGGAGRDRLGRGHRKGQRLMTHRAAIAKATDPTLSDDGKVRLAPVDGEG